MNLDRLLKDAAEKLRAHTAVERPPDLHRSRKLGFPFVAQIALAVVVVVTLVTVATNDTTDEPPMASSTTITTLASTTTIDGGETNPPATPPPLAEWVVSYPPTWDRVDNDLVATIDPSDTSSLTIATFPIRVGDQTCPHIPTYALQDLGSQDVVISVLFIKFESHLSELWPDAGFSESDFAIFDSAVDAQTCSGRDDLEVWAGPTTQPSGVTMFVAFGSDVDDSRRAETWAIVQSLRPQSNAHESFGSVCAVTTPEPFSLTPPPPWKPVPSDPEMAWWGTADLWTPLHIDGDYAPRKSVWWSQNFTDAGRESQPDIGISYERLDAVGRPIVSGSPGTNASTAQDGLFMIAGIDPPEPGCYRVTAEYKGATLSYVYNHQPDASGPSVTTTTLPIETSPATGPLFGSVTDEFLVFDSGVDAVLAIDPDARLGASTLIEGNRGGDQPYRIHRVGDHLVFGWGSIYAYSLETGESHLIARATLFVPAVEPDRIWIIDWARGSNIGTGIPSAWQIDMEGNVLTEPTELTSDSYAHIGVPGGLAVGTDAGIRLWTPETGFSDEDAIPRTAHILDTWGDLIAYCPTPLCERVVTMNLSTDEEKGVSLPAGTATWNFGGPAARFSPNGRYLAMTNQAEDLLVLDLTNPASALAVVAEGIATHGQPLYVNWAPDGQAVYAATYSYGASRLLIVRHDLDTRDTSTAILNFGGTIDFVVLTPAQAGSLMADSFDF